MFLLVTKVALRSLDHTKQTTKHTHTHTHKVLFGLLGHFLSLLNWTPTTYLMSHSNPLSHGAGNTATREREREREREKETELERDGKEVKTERRWRRRKMKTKQRRRTQVTTERIKQKRFLPWFHESEGCCRRVSSVLQEVAPKPSEWWRAGDKMKPHHN